MEQKPKKARKLPPHEADKHMDVLNVTGLENEQDMVLRLESGALLGPPRPLTTLLASKLSPA